MKDVMEAFQIFNKYISDVTHPTCCEHNRLYVLCSHSLVSEEDKVRLAALGFRAVNRGTEERFVSFRFGGV